MSESKTDAAPVRRFGEFRLDEAERQLLRGGDRVALNPRYFDALVLLVREPGRLVTKERFFEEVWRGVTVGDEALTQCIKSLRKALGDRPDMPRFIETVPKQGYRFVAEVEAVGAVSAQARPIAASPPAQAWVETVRIAGFGTLGGGVAGLIGGLLYGLGAVGSGVGAASVLLVLLAVTAVLAVAGALGVSAGMAAASLIAGRPWSFSILGAAAGGLVVGAVFNLLATDSFLVLLGRAPTDFTGGVEGAAFGAALATGARLGGGMSGRGWRPAIGAALACAVAGAAISLAGGQLMGGSLAALAHAFDQSRLELDMLGRLTGEGVFGPVTQAIATGVEGLLFGGCVVGAMLLAMRRGGRASVSPAPFSAVR